MSESTNIFICRIGRININDKIMQVERGMISLESMRKPKSMKGERKMEKNVANTPQLNTQLLNSLTNDGFLTTESSFSTLILV
jgi:hypothetical protein